MYASPSLWCSPHSDMTAHTGLTTPAIRTADPLDALLKAAGRRIRARWAVRYASIVLCAGASAAALAVIGADIGLAPRVNGTGLVGALLAGIVAGAAWAIGRSLPRERVAKLTERSASLKERLSSALELDAAGMAADGFGAAQHRDALQCISAVDLRALFPVRPQRETALAAAACLTACAALLIPALRAPHNQESPTDIAQTKTEGAVIIRLARAAGQEAEKRKLDSARKAAQEARRLGEAMQRGDLTKKQALIATQKLTAKLASEQQRLAAQNSRPLDSARRALEHALDDMAKSQPGKQVAPHSGAAAMQRAQEALRELAHALANQDQAGAQSAMQKLAEQMKVGSLSAKDLAQLGKALAEMAKALSGAPMDVSGQQAEQLAQMLQSMSPQDAQSLQRVAAMMRDLGKSLGRGMGQPMLDAKAVAALAQGLADARMQGLTWVRMHGGGRGAYGLGSKMATMKDPGKTTPRLMAMGQGAKSAAGKAGSRRELSKYLAFPEGKPAHMPNARISGVRLKNGEELSLPVTGDPGAAHSSEPYYSAYETSRREAESALNKENIPATYRDEVRKYFDGIRP